MTSAESSWRWRLPQIGIACTFVFLPLWLRLPFGVPLVTPYYVTQFLLFNILWVVIGLWAIGGFQGLPGLLEDQLTATFLLMLGLLALWAFASDSWAFMAEREPDLAPNAGTQFATVVLFLVVVMSVRPPPRWIIAALIVGLLWNSLLAGAQVALQSDVGLDWLGEFALDPARSGVSVVMAEDVRWLRPYALLPHPNVLAGYLGVCLLATVYGLVQLRGRVWWVVLAVFYVGLWAFLLTFSRAGWLGFAAGAFALLPLLWRNGHVSRRLWLVAGGAVVIGVVFFLIYQPFILARAGVGLETTEVYSVAERSLLNTVAVGVITESPLLGVGAGNFPWRASYYFYQTLELPVRGNNVHHVWLSTWAELGIVGLVLILVAMIVGVEAALRRIRLRDKDVTTRAVLLAGFIALAVIGLLDHYTYSLIQMQTLWWGILAVSVA